ncbi:hypothetical protein FPHYL_12500 [Fusarium phyllophilum]|uniref:Uncharacterized protein n=1 Tax=Fusarium phyllophilum TaxID=47803 RepID=A0A8H5IKL2_9HYPO|nr:hypothetical protein FPHYL_12500 [Fusarium phyllophilum]
MDLTSHTPSEKTKSAISGKRLLCLVNTIANIETPLERISILDVKGLNGASMSETRLASDAANKALADMIEAHSSSLRHVNIFFGVEKVVIQGCKKAKGLRSLKITLSDEALRQDIDGFLDSCPELVDFPGSFKDYSHRRSEWEDREQLRMDVGPFEMKLLEGRIIGA